MNVAVVGPGSDATPSEVAVAQEVGELVAREGWVLLTGGLGGIMEAASRGAADAGGIVVGVLPGGDPSAANPSVAIPLPSGLGEARNALLVNASEGIVVVGGSWGTLSELALAVRRGKPVVQIGGWRIITEQGSPPPGTPPVVTRPEDAVATIRREASGAR